MNKKTYELSDNGKRNKFYYNGPYLMFSEQNF